MRRARVLVFAISQLILGLSQGGCEEGSGATTPPPTPQAVPAAAPEQVTCVATIDPSQLPVNVNVSPPAVSVTNTIDPAQLPQPKMPVATFKGITSIPRDGEAGYGQINADCNREYPGSRLCRDTELMQSYPAPAPGRVAWFFATPVAAGSLRVPNLFTLTGVWTAFGLYTKDAGGASINCAHDDGMGPFSSKDNSEVTVGFVLAPDGTPLATYCGFAHVATCCGL